MSDAVVVAVAAVAVVDGNDVVEAYLDGESGEAGLDEEPVDEGNVEEDHAGNLVVEVNGLGGAEQIALEVLCKEKIHKIKFYEVLKHFINFTTYTRLLPCGGGGILIPIGPCPCCGGAWDGLNPIGACIIT